MDELQARRGRAEPGGIFALDRLIRVHRGAFEYDWRTRFNMPLTGIGCDMSWGEAIRMTECLAGDPSTMIGSVLAGWSHPITRENIAALDLYDLQHHIAWAQGGGKGPTPKPCPRPWDKPKASKRTVKPDEKLTQAEIVAALRFAGHNAPLPERR